MDERMECAKSTQSGVKQRFAGNEEELLLSSAPAPDEGEVGDVFPPEEVEASPGTEEG